MKYLLLILLLLPLLSNAQEYLMYAGTYTRGESKGIYIFSFDSQTGDVRNAGEVEGIDNPSFLTVSPNRKFLYAVNETGGQKPGTVSAFSINSQTGRLDFLNKQPTGGDHPCYLSVDKTGKWLMVGNYSGGSVSSFPIREDGSIDELAQLIQHQGRGPNPNRQKQAHVHATRFSPDHRYLLVPDLGLDQVVVYKFDHDRQKPLDEKSAFVSKARAGHGPRHIEFHPSRPYAYVVEELSGTVSVLRYQDGKLTEVQNISSHPKNYKGDIGSADIHMSDDGKFLYVSNRGESNSIAIFSVNKSLGMLKLVNIVSSGGVRPRNFAIAPGGNFLLVANEGSNNIVVFQRNRSTGLIRPTGKEIRVPAPVCLQFLDKSH